MSEGAQKPQWREHLGLVLSAALAGFVILRLLGVSNWDLTTALAIASFSGTSNVALSSVLASLPMLYATAVLSMLPTIVVRLARVTKVERSAALLGVTFPILLVLYLAPFVTFASGLAVLVAFWILVRHLAARQRRVDGERAQRPDPESPSHFERSAALIGCLAILLWATVSTPWLPTENVKIGDEPAFTGYVIGSRDQDVVVLRSFPRVIVVAPTSTLQRSLCSPDDPMSKSAMQFLTKPRYETCQPSGG